MADRRNAKLQKLEQFRRNLPHISASALAAVLATAEKEGIPERHSRHDIRHARDNECNIATPFGPLIQELDLVSNTGGRIKLNVLHPLAVLWSAVYTCTAFRDLFLARLEEKPSTYETPWSLIIYSDEVTPGAALSHDNLRKVQTVYYSFLELGPNVLAREDAWFCALAARSKTVNRVSGKMSQVIGAILKLMFAANSFNLMLGGITLAIEGHRPIRFWARMRIIIQDGAAHKETFHCKGDSGSKLCLLCKNVFTDKSNMVDEDGSELLRCNVIVDSELDLATDQDLRDAPRSLEARHATLPPGEFKKLEYVLGFVHQPHSLLLDRSLDTVLKPATHFMHDFMHCLFVTGVWNFVVYLLFESFIHQGRHGVYALFQGYVALWRWPSRITSTSYALSEIFNARRVRAHRKAKHIKCQASDAMSLVLVLAYFVQNVLLLTGLCNAECVAYLALADMIEFIISVPKGNVTPTLIRASVHKFLSLFVDAWGPEYLFPKMHWLLHFGTELQNFRVLLSCFVHERKHRMIKKYAEDACNTLVYERTILSEVLCHHFGQLRDNRTFDFNIGLINPRPVSRAVYDFLVNALELNTIRIQEVFSAKESRFSELATCNTGDAVILELDNTLCGGEVLAHLSVHTIPYIDRQCLDTYSFGPRCWRCVLAIN